MHTSVQRIAKFLRPAATHFPRTHLPPARPFLLPLGVRRARPVAQVCVLDEHSESVLPDSYGLQVDRLLSTFVIVAAAATIALVAVPVARMPRTSRPMCSFPTCPCSFAFRVAFARRRCIRFVVHTVVRFSSFGSNYYIFRFGYFVLHLFVSPVALPGAFRRGSSG